MRLRHAAWLLAGLLAAAPALTAQRVIILTDSLTAHAERLDVQKGAQWAGHIARWRFGDCAVVSSKGGWSTTRMSARFFNIEGAAAEKFSFVLVNHTGDSAVVDAARHVRVQALRMLQLGHGWSIGKDEVVEEVDNFIALVHLAGDTTETWALFIGVTAGDNTVGHYDAFLTNGTRRIFLATASSNKDITDLRGPPALGYEFIEGAQSLGALQYFGGAGGRPSIVWLHSSLDPRMKLILAATMTAVLQVRNL
jgi:hypothetical protein